MKARINYKSKKTIIIISVALVLLIAAITGTVAFVKGNRNASAAVNVDSSSSSQNGENNNVTNAGLPNNGDQNNGETVNDKENLPDAGNNGDDSSNTNGGTTGATTGNGSTNGTSNRNNGSSTTTTTGGANVPNQDYTQTTVIPGRENVLVEQNTEIGWSPISVAAYTAASRLKVHKPDLELQKYAYLDGDALEELPVNTAVQKGETITYVIKITNKGNEDAKNIRTIDEIPEGTELVSISEGGALNNEGKIAWKNDIKAGETVTVSFKAKVTADSVNLIKNTAKVNGEETPETKTPIITAVKTANVVTTIDKEEVLEDRYAKVGETIRYTITVKNTSEVDGTTVITDSIPDGTTLVDGTITENGKFDKENKTITWNNVVVPANSEVSVNFDVVVNAKTIAGEDIKSVKNTATVGNTPTEEVETKVANITTVKTSEGIHADGTPVTEENPLHELDKITYTLIATNIGNGKGTVKISDTVPEGTTLVADSIKIGNDTYTEKELNEGIDVTLEAGEKKSITFIVTINPFKDEKIVVRNADAKQDEKEVPPTDDEVIKEYVSIDVNKEFVDKENVDELRPTEIVVALYKNAGDATHIDTRTLNEQNNWKASFTNLDKYDFETQELIKYDAKELNVDKNYTVSYKKNNITLKITNTLKYESVLTNITANKVWNDNENKVGARKSITFELYADGVATGKTQTATADDWTVEFKNVQKYNKDGSEIKYTVIETTQVEHYNKPAYSDNGLTVTNTIDYTTFKTSVLATKKWIDQENAKRPEVTINLYQNGSEDVYATYTLKNGETSHEFTNLPKYDENGNEYLYTVEEAEVEGYTPEYSNDTLTITNVINQENTVKISGTKTWIAPEGKAFPTITIKLYKNGIFENKVELTNGTTNYEFNNLPKYKVDENGQYELDENGNVQLNVYTVEEADVKGYTSKKAENGFDFTNTINQEKITINGTKIWIDPQGTTHNPITINLLRDGKNVDHVTLANGTTSYEFKDLETYAPDGSIYNYSVEETKLSNYTSEKAENGVDFINTIKQEQVSVRGSKTWVIPAGKIVPTITINLLRDGEKVNSVELTNGTTSYSFENLDRYDLTDGHEYKYTVSEETVEGYKSEQNENNFTNTIEQDNTVIVSGNKTWVTPAGTTHPTVTINLLKNGEQYKTTTIANGNTTYEFTGLPKYKTDANGNFVLDVNGNIELNEYTVEEAELNGYTSEKAANGVDFVNTIDQELISISGEKTWVDPEGTTLVHPEITINLIKNGTKASAIKLANGNTKYEFTELPKYKTDENGKYVLDSNGNVQLNRYTIEEENVRNYTTSYNGYNITNTFNQDIQGTVEITTTTTSQTSVKTPLDVVFVLDISGSMNDNDKDKTMVDSVNTAISTIMNENPESRIGVVAYSSTYNSSLANANNATTLLPLGKYTPKTTGKYLTLQEGVLRGNNEKYDTITTNVNEKKNQTLNVYGGTYTQAGIKEGAGILTSANTKFTTTVNGKQKEITRTPVMILLSDGDPTYYNENYTTLSGKKYGNGSDTTENEAYYTIRTANYYKQQITSHYYGTTGTKSKFYTIGLNMSGTLSETILNPTSENVNKCNDEGTEGGYFTWRNVKGKLYDKIIADGSAGKYSYADQSYVGSMTTSDLQSIFNTIINDNSTSTETRDITVEESDARRVNLEGIDTSKEFTLTIGSHSYNFAQAQTAGYVKGNNTDGYYVDISNVAKGTTISISYNK